MPANAEVFLMKSPKWNYAPLNNDVKNVIYKNMS